MATVTLTLPDSILGAALTTALDRQQTLESFIELAIRNAVSSTGGGFQHLEGVDLEEVLNEAVTAAQAKPAGAKFLLKDLCDPQVWVCLTAGERKGFGKRFRKVVEDGGIAEHCEKSSSNQAIYQRR